MFPQPHFNNLFLKVTCASGWPSHVFSRVEKKKKTPVSDMEKVSSAEKHDGADCVGFSAFPEADASKKSFHKPPLPPLNILELQGERYHEGDQG